MRCAVARSAPRRRASANTRSRVAAATAGSSSAAYATSGADELDGVHEHVPGQQQGVGAGGDPHRLVSGRVTQGRFEVDAVAQPGHAVDLAQQVRGPQGVDGRLDDHAVVGHGAYLGGLDDVLGVREQGQPGATEHPAHVVLVEVRQHDGVDVRRGDAERRQSLGEPADTRCPRRGGAVGRPDAEVDDGDRVVGCDHHERPERQHPRVVRPEGRRVERPRRRPLLLGRAGEGLAVRGAERAGDVDERVDLEAADRPHRRTHRRGTKR